MRFKLPFRRRRDRWAEATTYVCSDRCHALFQVRDGSWWGNTNPEDYPDRWGKIGTWGDLEEMFGDCSAYLRRTYQQPPSH